MGSWLDGGGTHPGSHSQEVAELAFSESRAHMKRRGRRGHFHKREQAVQSPMGLGRPETEGVAVREESAFRAERLVGSEARKVERGQGMPGLGWYSKRL